MSISDSTFIGLRCGGKTGLAMSKAQQEFMDNTIIKMYGGFKSGEMYYIYGGRSQGKSYFQDLLLAQEPVIKHCEYISKVLSDDELIAWSRLPSYILMKTSSKQSRYVRVWRNK